jgi:asparagine synthase (glutamine-hydrolysing)
VRALLEETVRMRLRADVPVGCLLSGGLDSSAVLGVAAAHAAEPVTAFTVAFDEREYDESAAAADTARHTGARHVVVEVTDGALADHFHAAVWHGEMVQYNAHGTARYLLSRAIQRAGHKSVLAGEGADELFFGYEFLRAALPRGGSRGLLHRAATWLRIARRLLRSPGRAHPGLAAASPWLARLATLLDVSPGMLTRLEGGLGAMRSVLAPDFLRPFHGRDPYRDFYARCDARAGISAWEPARQLGYLWLR